MVRRQTSFNYTEKIHLNYSNLNNVSYNYICIQLNQNSAYSSLAVVPLFISQ